jgi:hypothetical protein
MAGLLELSLPLVAILGLLITALSMNTPATPKNLVADCSKSLEFSKLAILNGFIILVSILQVAGYIYFIVPIYRNPDSLVLYVLAFSWCVILLVSTRFNSSQNAFSGGHFSILCSLCLVGYSHVSRFSILFEILSLEFTVSQLVAISQFALLLILLLVIGFWKSRTMEDHKKMVYSN